MKKWLDKHTLRLILYCTKIYFAEKFDIQIVSPTSDKMQQPTSAAKTTKSPMPCA